jgi:hypothetical protein
MAASFSALSTEYVKVRVSSTLKGAIYNPTSDQVQMAFLTSQTATPQNSDWVTGSWETAANPQATRFYARVLVGPYGNVALSKGTYYVWVRVTDAPEIPVRLAGTIRID